MVEKIKTELYHIPSDEELEIAREEFEKRMERNDKKKEILKTILFTVLYVIAIPIKSVLSILSLCLGFLISISTLPLIYYLYQLYKMIFMKENLGDEEEKNMILFILLPFVLVFIRLIIDNIIIFIMKKFQ